MKLFGHGRQILVITIAAAMEAYIETVTNTKTIRVFQVVGCARDAEVMGIIIHDT